MKTRNSKYGEKGKECKAVIVHVIKAYRGRRGIVPLILNLSTKWR
jgi:hypothetical protein